MKHFDYQTSTHQHLAISGNIVVGGDKNDSDSSNKIGGAFTFKINSESDEVISFGYK